MAKVRKTRPVPMKSWPSILNHVRVDFDRDQVALVAGGVAFYWILALFPALATTVTVLALVVEPAALLALLNQYADLVPADILKVTRDQVEAMAANPNSLSFSAALWLLTSIWVSMAGIRGIISGINVAWDLDETRSYLWSTVIAFGLLALGLVVLILATLLFGALPYFRTISGWEGLETVAWFARWPLLALTMMGYLSVMYRVAPCRRAPPRATITPGSVLATLLFLGASAGFSYYVHYFATYDATYGSLSSGVVLLLWFWLSAMAVLVGAELDAEIEKAFHGPDRPQDPQSAAQTILIDRR